MMSIEQAKAYGQKIGVQYYVMNSHGCIVGGTTMLEAAEAMKLRFEKDERGNPFTGGTTKFYIKPVRA